MKTKNILKLSAAFMCISLAGVLLSACGGAAEPAEPSASVKEVTLSNSEKLSRALSNGEKLSDELAEWAKENEPDMYKQAVEAGLVTEPEKADEGAAAAASEAEPDAGAAGSSEDEQANEAQVASAGEENAEANAESEAGQEADAEVAAEADAGAEAETEAEAEPEPEPEPEAPKETPGKEWVGVYYDFMNDVEMSVTWSEDVPDKIKINYIGEVLADFDPDNLTAHGENDEYSVDVQFEWHAGQYRMIQSLSLKDLGSGKVYSLSEAEWFGEA